MEFLNSLEDVVDYHVVLFFRGAVVWPRQVLQVRDRASIANQEFPFDQIRHYWLNWDQSDSSIIELDLVFNLNWPILVALLLAVFFSGSEHNDEIHMLLFDHSPKVLCSCDQRALRRNKQLVIPRHARVYIVCINVWIVNVLIPLEKTDARVFDYILLKVHIETYKVWAQSIDSVKLTFSCRCPLDFGCVLLFLSACAKGGILPRARDCASSLGSRRGVLLFRFLAHFHTWAPIWKTDPSLVLVLQRAQKVALCLSARGATASRPPSPDSRSKAEILSLSKQTVSSKALVLAYQHRCV